ncbi:hypothetical protein [Paenibacillus methanolicus]|uniref:YhfM-like domain-containing protein n=1 Tax=Paenibacillus methanolicus TaxID=582686 RepID=A0A5S5BY55_9BACL|nr:hypothetical protein [Paenibacillus methanolicus]TYP71236.1 hypothetical protein BCM02_110186 [Paenibacillus methanolicus]
MKRLRALGVSFLLIWLIGCRQSGSAALPGLEQVEAARIASITAQEQDGPGRRIDDPKTFQSFVEAMNDAEYDSAIFDIRPPDFAATVRMEDDALHVFSFWLKGDEPGLATKETYSGHYKLTDAAKAILSELFRNAAPLEREKDGDAVGPLPPELRVVVGDRIFAASLGGYCWKDACADVPSNEELAEKQKFHVLGTSGENVRLAFGTEPDEVSVMVSFPDEERPNESLKYDGSYFRLAAGAGEHLYIVQAKWPQGSASYVFKVEVEPSAKR